MKTMKRIILLAGIAAMAGFALPSPAADAPAPAAQTFGVVDMNKVMQTTDAAKDIFSQLDGRRKEYQAQISKEEETLRAVGQELEKQKGSLSKEEFDKKAKEFEEKISSGQKLVNGRKQILDMAFNASMSSLRDKAAKIVSDVAREKGYSAVFTQDAVILSTPDLDMTDAVIERLNKSVAKLPVEWPAADAPADAAKKGKGK